MSHKDLVNLRKSINRERLKTRPPLPKNNKETFEALKQMQANNETIEVETEFGAKNLSIHIDNNQKLVMLYSKESLTALCSDGTIQLGDGTFKFCPKFFAQVCTLHASSHGANMPGVYFLLRAKTFITYKLMFKELIKKTHEFGLHLDIKHFVLDFERAVIKACKFFSLASNIGFVSFILVSP